MRNSDEDRGDRKPRQRRDREGERSPADIKERLDREFSREVEMRISYFMQSSDRELELEPMNSYRRRLVHNLAGKYNLQSESRGEDRERYVCLIKTTESVAPTTGKVRLWDFGSQTYHVNPGPDGIRMALKADGSVEALRDEDRSQVLDDRLVTTHEFRVRQGKILIPGDPGY